MDGSPEVPDIVRAADTPQLKHLIHADRLKVVTLEAFIQLANNGQL